MIRREFSYSERKIIEEKLNLGWSGHQIAEFLNRSTNGINYEVRKNGSRSGYIADEAQAKSDQAKADKYEKIAGKATGKPSGITLYVKKLEEKIEAMQCQIDIILDLLKVHH